MARATRKLTFPKEHGALVTLTGAAVLAAVTAPRPDLALLASIALFAAYLSRGPIERRVAHLALRPWDAPALLLYMVVVTLCVGVLARAHGWAALAIAVVATAIPAAGALARAVRAQRALLVETVGLTAVGATAGVAAYAGGTPYSTAGAMGIALGAYGAVAILIVRAQIREEKVRNPRANAALALALLFVAAGVSALVVPLLAAAFAPRAAHAALRIVRPPPEVHIYHLAARETAEIALFVALFATFLHL